MFKRRNGNLGSDHRAGLAQGDDHKLNRKINFSAQVVSVSLILRNLGGGEKLSLIICQSHLDVIFKNMDTTLLA